MRQQSAPSSPNDHGASPMNLGQLLFSFEGRINRLAYWLLAILFVPYSWLIMAIATNQEILELYRGVMVLVMVWPMLAVQAKRWHDIDMSGWWLWVNLLPIAGPLITLVMTGFLPGTRGENHFGPATRQWQLTLQPFRPRRRHDAGQPTMAEAELAAITLCSPSYPVSLGSPVYPQFG